MPKLVAASNRIYRVTPLSDVGGTVSPDSDDSDLVIVTLDTSTTMANPSGSPHDGQRLSFRIYQDATGSRTLTWGSDYAFPRSDEDAYLNLVPNSVSTYEFRYDENADKWRLLMDWAAAWGIVARNTRGDTLSNIPSDGSSTPIMGVTASVLKNRTYNVTAHGELLTQSGHGTSNAECRLYYTTDGSEPAGDPSPDTLLTRTWMYLPFDNTTVSAHLEANYLAASDHTLRVILTAQGVLDGSHVYDWVSTSAESYLMIEDTGPLTVSAVTGGFDYPDI